VFATCFTSSTATLHCFRRFLRNIGAICAFAFGGTVVSTAAVGLIMWAAGEMGLSYGLTFIQALVFGSIISTTDTVRQQDTLNTHQLQCV